MPEGLPTSASSHTDILQVLCPRQESGLITNYAKALLGQPELPEPHQQEKHSQGLGVTLVISPEGQGGRGLSLKSGREMFKSLVLPAHCEGSYR